MADLWTLNNLAALLTLTALEIVLGIDNIIFIAIVTKKLDAARQAQARFIGLALAALMRVLLLLAITWIMGLTAELFSVFGVSFSGQSLILLGGGLFLIAKATWEIHDKLEAPKSGHGSGPLRTGMTVVILQILALDLVFSLDSVITAVGMVRVLPVMVAAILIAVAVMILFAGPVSRFVERHPAMQMLALAFLVLIGVMLVSEGFGQHVERGYVYFAMAFSFVVELLNMRVRRRHEPVQLHQPRVEGPAGGV